MTQAKVKICGLTNFEDALLAVKLGADFLGFVMYPPSKRYVSPETVRSLIAALPPAPAVLKVGVFVNAAPEEVCRMLDFCGLDIAQLHGTEAAAVAEHIGLERVWKAFCLRTPQDVETAAAYPAAAVLADAMLPGLPGGTGTLADWTLAAALARRRPLVLAGGLTPDNVAAAVRQVAPFAVDTASGTEAAPGVKSRQRLQDFIAAVKMPGSIQ